MLTFKVRGPKDAASVSIPTGSVFSALKEEIRSKLQEVPPTFDLLMGFPPQLLQLEEDTIIDGHIANNESLRVQKKELQGVQVQGASPAGKKKPSAASAGKALASSSSGKSNSNTGVKSLQPMKAATKISSSTSKAPAAGSSFGARIATLSGTSSGSSGFGRGSSATRKKTTRAPRVSNTASSEADISEHLIAAVNGGSGSRDKVLRKVFRHAVEHQYNSAKALSRLSAVYSGQYSINENTNARLLNSGASVKIDVTFQKGSGSRTSFEETVDLLPDEVLLELLKIALHDTEGAGREVLKPMNLSKCSPRIFWSLVYQHGQNLIQTIKTLLQGVDDCAWLTERKKELSEKAKENLRQQQEKEAAVRQRKAKKRKADEEESVIVLDDDEEDAKSAEEPKAAPVTLQEAELEALRSVSFAETVPEEWMVAVRTVLGGEQALSLANVVNVHDFTNQLNTSEAGPGEVSEDQVEYWIQSAQVLVLQAFWCRLCGGGCERLRKALHGLRLRAPKAFLSWKSAAEGLHKGIVAGDPTLKDLQMIFPSTVSSSNHSFSVDAMKWMIQRCVELVQSFSWVNQHDNIVEEEDEDDAEDEEKEADEEWLTTTEAHEYMGKRGRVFIRDVATLIDGIPTTYHNHAFWEDGRITAYLPATEEEPMALWRITLDPVSNKKETKPRCEDLEEEEVQQALARISAAVPPSSY